MKHETKGHWGYAVKRGDDARWHGQCRNCSWIGPARINTMGGWRDAVDHSDPDLVEQEGGREAFLGRLEADGSRVD
jgi:hypothetical protein